jgi:hypothetical protein
LLDPEVVVVIEQSASGQAYGCVSFTEVLAMHAGGDVARQTVEPRDRTPAMGVERGRRGHHLKEDLGGEVGHVGRLGEPPCSDPDDASDMAAIELRQRTGTLRDRGE